MINFWQWVQSRQDARQWSEDEKACAELAWKAAIKLKTEELNGAHLCPKCGLVCDCTISGNSHSGVA